MPYITQEQRDFIVKEKEVNILVSWLTSIPIQDRKGFVAFIVNYLGKYSFTENYFGFSTGTDAVRSAYEEMVKELKEYENEKKAKNGAI